MTLVFRKRRFTSFFTFQMKDKTRDIGVECSAVEMRALNYGLEKLARSRSVSCKVRSSGGIRGTFVDHAGCSREFTIQSGGVIAWDEALEIPDLSQGSVEVEVSVQVVNPRRCGSWGNCAAMDFKSNKFEIR